MKEDERTIFYPTNWFQKLVFRFFKKKKKSSSKFDQFLNPLNPVGFAGIDQVSSFLNHRIELMKKKWVFLGQVGPFETHWALWAHLGTYWAIFWAFRAL